MRGKRTEEEKFIAFSGFMREVDTLLYREDAIDKLEYRVRKAYADGAISPEQYDKLLKTLEEFKG